MRIEDRYADSTLGKIQRHRSKSCRRSKRKPDQQNRKVLQGKGHRSEW
jgi:hypothetical protein